MTTATAPYICEIRIPTYKRPDMLERAIGQLAAQTVLKNGARLHGVIFDDSPAQEGRAIVRKHEDRHPGLTLSYRPNRENLGISRNLGQCFRTAAYEPSDHVFCLEDDNSVFPGFIAANIRLLEETGTAIAIRNQYIETTDNEIDHTRTTMPDAWATDSAGVGVLQPTDLLTCLFTNLGISNGALFWRSDAASELMIGEDCADPVLIEYLRPFAIREPVAFANTPLGAWRDNEKESFRILANRMQDRLTNYRGLKAISALRRAALAAIADNDRAALYERAAECRWGTIDRAYAHALIPARPRVTGMAALARHWAKGLACHALPAAQIGERSAGIVRAQLAWLANGLKAGQS
ncbi:glycosyltransferase [Aquisalinus flavus]|uniref:glycosyltransferase n=1 Tax=Aquisalinus flavus TaxID=1526572 RepID=UPI00165ED221|nr:glycosyltransferase [Aquisalinus flavus]MBD0425453.1 glycosyltransferase [Aquisalinus flavus]UNE48908.1 glycosyltransferase family 2 protein [Aquisalinus flavus]